MALRRAIQTSSASAGIVAAVVRIKNDTQPSLSASIPPEVLLWFATAATRTFLHLLSHQAFEIQRHPLYRIDKSINRFPQPRGLIYGAHKVCNGVMDKGSK